MLSINEINTTTREGQVLHALVLKIAKEQGKEPDAVIQGIIAEQTPSEQITTKKK